MSVLRVHLPYSASFYLKSSIKEGIMLPDQLGSMMTQADGDALNKCWNGFKIAKLEFDTKNMFHYAKGIRKFKRELRTSVSELPQFGLFC
jgi:hypothetical protein